MWNWLPQVAGTVAPIVEGVLNRDAARENNYQNRLAQDQANQSNAALQREFAKNGIRWRVDDARAAGLHPLAALGASGASFSPSFGASHSDPESLGSAVGALGNMGQNISRAISSTSTAEEKQFQKLQLASAQLNLEGQALENQLKLTQLNRLNSTGPAFPSTKQDVPLKRTMTSPGSPHMEDAHVADTGWAKTQTGIAPIPSTDVKERIEDQFVPEMSWALRNYLLPNVGLGTKPPAHLLPPGFKSWEWSVGRQEWQPSTKGSREDFVKEYWRKNEPPDSVMSLKWKRYFQNRKGGK